MMKFYQDLTLLPDEGVDTNFLMSKVFTKIHGAIMRQKKITSSVKCAVAFPEYSDKTLGNKIRVFGLEEDDLAFLNLKKGFMCMGDYVHVKSIKDVDDVAKDRIKGNVVFSMYRPNRNRFALAKRYAQRHGCSYEEALHRYTYNEKCNLPYVVVNSKSTGQKFSLFISKKDVDTNYKVNSYGLGYGAGLPDF